jgi:tRNA dimethylallyltransferase
MRSETRELPKLIVILGPTASGKTGLSLRLAKKIGGEIIHADSRQIYKKMSIGTAKPESGQWINTGDKVSYYVDDVPHHLIDFLDPGKSFTVAQFRDTALKYVKLARKRGRHPMIVGGTGLYIQALIDNYTIPRIPPNNKLRRSLEEKTDPALLLLLEALDPEAVKKIDKKNKRRIIRALEVSILSGEPFSAQQSRGEPIFDTLKIGINVPREELYQRINVRVDKMIDRGLVEEVKGLMRQKYNWELPSMSGVGYRQFRPYLEGNISLEEAINNLKRDTRRYARRQMTWFRRDPEIYWVSDYKEAESLVEGFLAEKS